MPVIAALFGAIGSIFSGFFNFKGQQAQTVQDTLKLLGDVNTTDAQAQVAAANALSVILSQGSWLERSWRPLFMLICMIIIVSFWFGHIPAHFNDPLSPMMDKVMNLLEIGLGGYIPCRTLDKAIQQINIGSILKTLIKKKIG